VVDHDQPLSAKLATQREGQEGCVEQEPRAVRWEVAVYTIAILGWAALGIWYKPILSMVLAPFVTPFLVAYLPHQLARLRGRAR
jgi:hypothetical protein